MASNKDKGASQSPPWAFDVLGVAQAAANDMVTELSSFTTFQRRVDELIRNLKGSPADPSEGRPRTPRARAVRRRRGRVDGGRRPVHFVRTVITELETLSRLLSDSIEGMGIAVLASHQGYQNIDADVRKRMAAISVETKKHYGGDYTPVSRSRRAIRSPVVGRRLGRDVLMGGRLHAVRGHEPRGDAGLAGPGEQRHGAGRRRPSRGSGQGDPRDRGGPEGPSRSGWSGRARARTRSARGARTWPTPRCVWATSARVPSTWLGHASNAIASAQVVHPPRRGGRAGEPGRGPIGPQ